MISVYSLPIFRHKCPDGKPVKKLSWYEQGGHGLVDVSMECLEGTTFRFVNNDAGFSNNPKTCEDGFALLQAREQDNYGIINARMECVGGGTSDSNTNLEGQWNDALSCNSDYVITGLEVREQGGPGIINVKILCGFYALPGQLNLNFSIEYFVHTFYYVSDPRPGKTFPTFFSKFLPQIETSFIYHLDDDPYTHIANGVL